MNYYVVDSVKGGCGKTTLAIWKALDLQYIADKAVAKKKGKHKKLSTKVCYIDLDLLGTSTEAHVGQDKDSDTCYLNELFYFNRHDVKKKKVKSTKYFEHNNVNGDEYTILTNKSMDAIKIGMVFSSPDQEMKNNFRPNYQSNRSHVDFEFFAMKINELFKELNNGGYTDIVVDMPPNSDPYTDSIFDLLLNMKSSEETKVKMMVISTYDRSHINANREWCCDLLQKDQRWKIFDDFEWYFNDVRNSIPDSVKIEELVGEPCRIVSTLYNKSIKAKAIKYSPKSSYNAISCENWSISLIINDINYKEG